MVDFVRFVDEIRVYGDELIGPRLRCIEVSKFQRRSQTWHQVEKQYIPRTKDFGLSLVDFVGYVDEVRICGDEPIEPSVFGASKFQKRS